MRLDVGDAWKDYNQADMSTEKNIFILINLLNKAQKTKMANEKKSKLLDTWKLRIQPQLRSKFETKKRNERTVKKNSLKSHLKEFEFVPWLGLASVFAGQRSLGPICRIFNLEGHEATQDENSEFLFHALIKLHSLYLATHSFAFGNRILFLDVNRRPWTHLFLGRKNTLLGQVLGKSLTDILQLKKSWKLNF